MCVLPGPFPLLSREPVARLGGGHFCVHAALALCDRVSLYGFSSDGPREPFHYWPDQWADRPGTSFHHELALEHAHYRTLARRAASPPLRVCINRTGLSASTAIGAESVPSRRSAAAGPVSPPDVRPPHRAIPARPFANRTLVCILGSLRGSVVAWQSLRRHVIAPLKAELAVLASWEESEETLRQLAPTHVWRVPEYDDWALLLDELLPAGWMQRVRLQHNLWGPIGGMRGSGAIIFGLRMVLLHYLDALAAAAPGAYSRLVLTRSDHLYACAHPEVRAVAGAVVVMEGPNEHGITDRHTLLAFADRHRVLPVLPWLVEKHPNLSHANPETALRAFYATHRLRVLKMPRVAFVVTSGSDPNRWASRKEPCNLASSAPRQRLYLKYPAEHFLAVRSCQHDPCPFKPPHEQLARLFGEGDNATTGTAPSGGGQHTTQQAKAMAKARVEVLGSYDHGYIDGVRWRQ